MEDKDVQLGTRMERKREATRRRIISAAMELFRRQGFEGTTMEQIARQADVAKGTLYNYFPVKEAIISSHIRLSFRESQENRLQRLMRMPDTRARMILILEILMEGVQQQPDLFEKYMVYEIQNMISVRREGGMKSGLRDLGEEIIRWGQESRELRGDLPREMLVALFEFAFIEVAQEFYTHPRKFKARQTIEHCVDLFMHGAQLEGSKDYYRYRR